MSHFFPLDQPVIVTLRTFSDDAETVPADPTTLALTVLAPDGTETVYTWAGAGLVRTGLGVFTWTRTLSAGDYNYHGAATGAVATGLDGSFTVLAKYGVPQGAFRNLASANDLLVRGVDITDADKVTAMLASASAAIRDAAGVAITLETSTVTIPGGPDEFLTLPGTVRSVATVEILGTLVDDWELVGNQLWRFGGWQLRLTNETSFFLPSDRFRPVLVTVTYTHGLDAVPADIVSLCCDLATAGLLSDGPIDPRLANRRMGDYSEGFVTGPEAQTSLFELPERTKAMLRDRFGTQTFVTGARQ